MRLALLILAAALPAALAQQRPRLPGRHMRRRRHHHHLAPDHDVDLRSLLDAEMQRTDAQWSVQWSAQMLSGAEEFANAVTEVGKELAREAGKSAEYVKKMGSDVKWSDLHMYKVLRAELFKALANDVSCRFLSGTFQLNRRFLFDDEVPIMKKVRKSQVMGKARGAAEKLGRALNARFDRREEIKIKVLTRAYELAYPSHGRNTGINHDGKRNKTWYNGIAACGEPEKKDKDMWDHLEDFKSDLGEWWDKL